MRAALTLAATALVLQGCAAAAIPVVAGGMMGRSTLKHRKARMPRATAPRSAPAPASAPAPGSRGYTILPIHELPRPTAATPPGSMQFLYGSGEAAALDLQAYMALATYLVGLSSDRAIGHDVPSVVLAPGATLDAPRFLPCAGKPPAIVFDIDETAILNLGFEGDAAARGESFDAQRWSDWERTGAGHVAVVPGLLDVVKLARIEKIAVVFNSNRSAANAAQTAAMLDGVGLGPVVRGSTLWLQGDAGGTNGDKDSRRWAIAAKYCVVAMSGDQLGDFSDLFNAPGLTPAGRRAAVGRGQTAMMWGHGWFVLPNPVYGTALKGDTDAVFPPSTRWAPTPIQPAAATPPIPATKEK